MMNDVITLMILTTGLCGSGVYLLSILGTIGTLESPTAMLSV